VITTDRALWLRYMGLPWRWNADPDRDRATDCFRLTRAVLGLYGAPRPARVERVWYVAAGRGWWVELHDELARISRPVSGGKPLDVAMLAGGEPIAMAVCVAGGLLTASKAEGVHWRPLADCTVLSWLEFLPPPALSDPT